MKNIQYAISFGIAFVCVMLCIACDNISDTLTIHTPVENGYGRININLAVEESAARTALPSIVFDKYVYTFTREDEETGTEKIPDSAGFFLLELGSYTVEVQAYTGTAEPYTLVASGVSLPFSVGPGNNAPVRVPLSAVDTEGKGKFTYTVTYPADAEAIITLQRWRESDTISINPVTITWGNGVTETLELEAGSYLLTVLVKKTNSYAGISEVVRIYLSLPTEYAKNFIDEDFLKGIPITVNDYTISGTGTFTYDGAEKAVTITRKPNASTGAVTIFYNGQETPPVNAGTYAVTLNVEAVGEWLMLAGSLSAGTITINKANPTISTWPTAANLTYGAALSASALSGGIAAPAGTFAWTDGAIIPAVINSGYEVTFTPNDAANYNTVTNTAAITVYKAAGAVVNAPTGTASATSSSITVNAVTAPGNGQTIEYAINTADSVPTTGWQSSTTFSGLSKGTTYYIFARSKENTNYYAGEVSASLKAAVPYTVTFSINSGTGTTPAAQMVSPITGITLPDTTGFSRSGCTFGGWNINTYGTGTNYNAGSTYIPTGDITLYARWTYVVTFSINGGTGTPPAQQMVPRNYSTTLPDESGLTRSGYTFGGWNTKADGKGTNYTAGSSFAPSSDNITLYANWTSVVTYNVNDGDGTTPNSQTVSASSGITLPDGSGLTKTGYTFGGWNTRADGTGTNYTAGSSYTPTGNITLYANWTSVVTFNVNGGAGTTPASQTAAHLGSGITLPNGSGLTKTGCTFGGWNTKADGTGTNYTGGSSYIPAGNITLYAKWTAVVTFNVNGGTGTTPASQTAEYLGSSITLPDGSGLTRTGWTFGGWNTNTSGTGTNYTAGASYTVNSNITLYAKWTAVVTFDINGGTGTTPDSQTISAGSSFKLPNGSGFAKSDYVFSGWNTKADGTGTNYNADASYSSTTTGDITLYARWKEAVTVTFDNNGGIGTTPASQTVASGTSITLPGGSGLTKSDYVFSGWNANTSGTGTNYNANASYTVTANITLYARWKTAATVTFNINGGSGTTPASQTVASDASITLPGGSGLTKSGYVFGGWNTKADGTGTNYNANASYPATANITLYVKWVVPATVTFNINGGSGTTPASQAVAPSSGITLPGESDLTKSGYVFGGWNTKADGTGTNYNGGASYTVTANITLYAKWRYPVVTLDINGGYGTPASQTGAPGSGITLPNGSDFTKSGYKFGGWNTKADGTGTNYGPGASYTIPANDITLYARWATGYVISFDIDGGTGTTPVSLVTNSSVTLPNDSGFYRSGYTFDGWSTGSAVYKASSTFTPTSSITMKAKWTIIPVTQQFTVTYNINGGSGTTPSSQTVTSGSSITLNSGGGFSRTGYLFAGWNTNSSGTGDNYNAGSSYTPKSSITLYAKWVVGYTVTFNAHDATSGSPPDAINVQAGKSITLPNKGTLLRTGYTFNGWYTASGSNYTYYKVGDSFIPTANTIMYADWR